jgi:hypothetical protein
MDARQGFLFQRAGEKTDRSFKLPYYLLNGSECGCVYLQQEVERLIRIAES